MRAMPAGGARVYACRAARDREAHNSLCGAPQGTAEQLHDARMTSLLAQKQRYQMSVAEEKRTKLRQQATFRHTERIEAPSTVAEEAEQASESQPASTGDAATAEFLEQME